MSFFGAAGPFGHASKALRSLPSMAAESKSPLMPRMMLLGCTYFWCQSTRSWPVMAAGDAVAFFLLGDVDFFGAELRVLQDVDEGLEYVVEVSLEAGEVDRGGVRTAAGFHLGRADFEEVVELITGLGLGAAGAPDLTVNIHEAGFVGRLVDRAAADAGSAVDQRQFMILLQKDHHAVRKLNTLGLLRLESGQGRNGNLLPACGLCRCLGNGRKGRGGEQQCESKCPLHCAPPLSEPPWSPPPGAPPPPEFSITPTVRLVSTNTSLETRRMSAFVTWSMRSTDLNNSRQSP